MRIRMITLTLLCLLLPAIAFAELGLELSMELVPAGSVLDFSITGEKAESYRYTLLKDGKELFTTDTGNAFGSYLPRETGSYTLKAVSITGGVEVSATAGFQVVAPLRLTCGPLPETVHAGGAVQVIAEASGGTEPYRYVYAITRDGETVTEETGSDHWYWAAVQEGSYQLHIAVVDSQGASVMLHSPLRVEPSSGIGLTPSGGALLQHGGQESWMVCSAQPWTAETDADFLRIETPSGQPGGQLAVTAISPTNQYREGIVRITSGKDTLEWTVSQSAQQGVDEEVFLFADAEPLLIDGQQHTLWSDASGRRSFTVAPAGSLCEVSADADFLSASLEGDTLTVTAQPSQAAAVRSGIVTLYTPGSCAYVHVYQLPGQAGESSAAASGLVWHSESIYSQFSGLWKDEKYGSSTLEQSGCAIFALSHALERLGFEGDSITPQALAKKYAFCLRDGGTINSTLIGNAGDDFGYKTRFDLYQDLPTIRTRLEQGALFSFAVVSGHIALVAETSEDGSMLRIIDSAPSATWERIKGAQLYRQTADGTFAPVAALSELEGIRYYPENNAFGGTTYWLESSYVARRGVRLIQLKTK